MWNISKEVKGKFLKYNLLPIHESDQDWEIALREAKEEGEDLISYNQTLNKWEILLIIFI
jgi:hypothetical protein